MHVRTPGQEFAFEDALAIAHEQDAEFFEDLADRQEGRRRTLLLGEAERCRNNASTIRYRVSFLQRNCRDHLATLN